MADQPSYFLALIDIEDPATYDRYLAGFDRIFADYQGEVMVVDDAPEVLEGDWPARRTVLIRFPSRRELRRWYTSPDYQAIARYRRSASRSRVAVLAGRY
ncbi:MAG: DUF1330 domain-containing protein [Acidobacteriota bacterium]